MNFQKTVSEKTALKTEHSWTESPSVLFVGFNKAKLPHKELDLIARLAGYEVNAIKPLASAAEYYLTKKDTITPSLCVVASSYKYPENLVPLSDAKYCSNDGLPEFQTSKKTEKIPHQGFQFVRRVKNDFPKTKFAIYTQFYKNEVNQAKTLGVDTLREPYAIGFPNLEQKLRPIYEHLRENNEHLFGG